MATGTNPNMETRSTVTAAGQVNHAFIYLIAAAAAISGFLFGFDTAVINGALIFLRLDFHLTALQTEFAAGSLLMGCLVGAGGAGSLSDRFGRKRILLAAAALFALSSIATALPQHLSEFVVARFIAGVAIGVASVLAPMYIAEVSPPRIRGQLVSLNQMAIVTGILAAFCTSWALSGLGQSSWRWMFAVAAIPSIAFLLALLFIPESPRWLIRAGLDEKAMSVLRKVSGPAAESDAEQIRSSLVEESGSFRELLAPHLRRPLFIGITLAVLQQITGINTVMYYGAILFKEHGGSGSAHSAIGINVTIGVVNFVCTFLMLMLIDRLGRRFLLLAGSAGMAAALVLLAAALRVSPPPTFIILGAVLAYSALFNMSLGPATWLYFSELFPTAIRGRAVSVATLSLWSACLAVTLTFLSLMQLLTPSGAFLLYAAMSVLTFVFVWRWVPETKNRSLEEIQQMWHRKQS